MLRVEVRRDRCVEFRALHRVNVRRLRLRLRLVLAVFDASGLARNSRVEALIIEKPIRILVLVEEGLEHVAVERVIRSHVWLNAGGSISCREDRGRLRQAEDAHSRQECRPVDAR